MRISDWSSDVCSSDLPWITRSSWAKPGCSSTQVTSAPALRAAEASAAFPALGSRTRWPGLILACSMTWAAIRSEEDTSELPSLMRISNAVFGLKKKKRDKRYTNHEKQINNKSNEK